VPISFPLWPALPVAVSRFRLAVFLQQGILDRLRNEMVQVLLIFPALL